MIEEIMNTEVAEDEEYDEETCEECSELLEDCICGEEEEEDEEEDE